MISTCRHVLSGLRKLASNSEDLLCFLGDTYCICLYEDTDKTYDYTKYKGEINSIIKQLVSDGYMEYAFNEFHFTLTQRGLHPYRFQWENIKIFLLQSIFVPIVVSIATTLITLLITSLLQGWL